MSEKLNTCRGGGFSEIGYHASKPAKVRIQQKGVGLEGGFKGVYRCTGVLSARRAPPPPQMKYIVSGASEKLGLRPMCYPTICTSSTNVYGRVSSPWVFPDVGTRYLGTVGLHGGHGV